EFRGFAKLGERSWVISLTAENSSKQQPRGGELGIELDGAMAVRGGFGEITEFRFGECKLEIGFGGRFDVDCAAKFGLRGGEVLLQGVDARDQTVRADVRRIFSNGDAEFLESGGLVAEIELASPKTIVRIRPPGLEPQGSLEFLGSRFRVALVFESQR